MLCAKRTLLFPLTFEWAVTLADAITTPLLVVLITGTFALTASTFGYLHAAGGIGSLIGSYLAGHYFKKTGNYYAIFFGGLLLFCSYFVISFPLPVFILFFVRLLGQCGEGVRQVKVHTYFGTETDDASRGSMIGLINASISIVYVFGYILSGLAVTWIDIRVVFMVTALLSAVLYLGIFIKGNARSHDRGESL